MKDFDIAEFKKKTPCVDCERSYPGMPLSQLGVDYVNHSEKWIIRCLKCWKIMSDKINKACRIVNIPDLEFTNDEVKLKAIIAVYEQDSTKIVNPQERQYVKQVIDQYGDQVD